MLTLKQRRRVRSVLFNDMRPHIFTRLESMLPHFSKGLLNKVAKRKGVMNNEYQR